MIKNLETQELEKVMAIWLQTNLSAHPFVDEAYWRGSYEFVEQILPTSDVKVFVEDGIVKGFMGVVDNYVAGLFVGEVYQGQHIGSQLMKECQARHDHLFLDVYVANEQAVRFYEANGFKIIHQKENEETRCLEYSMAWHQGEATDGDLQKIEF
ncbi:MAG: N-acetyltransferase [Cellulosilyticaceae bacterium]